MNLLKSKFKASLVLTAIGDALGWITEFERSKANIHSKFGVDRIEDFYEWQKNVGGRFNGFVDQIQAGSYSDDTQLMLSVARSLLQQIKSPENYFAEIELPHWLSYARGAGRTIKNASKKITRKSAHWNNNFFTFKVGDNKIDYRDCGANGAAMRILPIALKYHDHKEELNDHIFCNSIVTHGHPRAILGAQVFAQSISYLITTKQSDFDWVNFLIHLGKDIKSKYSLNLLANDRLALWKNKWETESEVKFEVLYDQTLTEIQVYLRDIYVFLRDDKPINEVIKELGCFDPATRSSGVSTVIASIYLLCKFRDNQLGALTEAVNLIGTDSDSIAAFVGGMLGALYGESIIKDKWLIVQDCEYIQRLGEELYDDFTQVKSDISKALITNSLSLKSVDEIKTDNYSVGERVFFTPLGEGTISDLSKQDALSKGKYNLLLVVKFDVGQSCLFSKLLNI